MVSLKPNSTTDISFVNLEDIERFFWMVAFKVIAIKKIKNKKYSPEGIL